MENSNQLVKTDQKESNIHGSFILRILEKTTDFTELEKFGKAFLEMGFVPAHYKDKKDWMGALVAIETGQKLGIDPLQSLVDISNIKGIPVLKGDLIRTLLLQSNVVEKWEESSTGTFPNDDYTHIIITKRKGWEKERMFTYSVKEAKENGFWITPDDLKANPSLKYSGWVRFPKRMVAYRNVGFTARDHYPDVLRGFKEESEVIDYEDRPGNITIKNETPSQVQEMPGSVKVKANGKVTTGRRKVDKPEADKKDSIPDAIAEPVIELSDEKKSEIAENIRTALKGEENPQDLPEGRRSFTKIRQINKIAEGVHLDALTASKKYPEFKDSEGLAYLLHNDMFQKAHIDLIIKFVLRYGVM